MAEVFNNKTASMEEFLCDRISLIKWPRETIISFQITDDGKTVFIDTDLPEESDIPNKTSEMPSRGIKLKIKMFSETQIRKLYLEHIHSSAFRTIGEAFHSLQTINSVVFSGFSQRASKETGSIINEYLLSAKVNRNEWEEIDFNNLGAIDVIPAMHRFNMRIDMTKTGILKSIEPFSFN